MAIYQPNEMDFSDKKFSVIISGPPGIGKTTLALSAPNPILIDFDKGISRVKAQHRKATAMISRYEELLEDMSTQEFQRAETVVIDTGGAFITYLQDWAMRKDAVNRQKSGGISMKGFGAVKAEFVRFTSELKTIHNKNVIHIFHTQEEKDKDGNIIQRLQCEGSARNIVWQPCDLGAFMFIVKEQRKLGFSPTEDYFAKGCYNISGVWDVPTLTEQTDNDFFTRLFDEARQNIALEAKYFEEEKRRYDDAIIAGHALVEAVTDLETVKMFGEKMKALDHALTSEAEIRHMFVERLKALNIRWNKEARQYEQTEV